MTRRPQRTRRRPGDEAAAARERRARERLERQQHRAVGARARDAAAGSDADRRVARAPGSAAAVRARNGWRHGALPALLRDAARSFALEVVAVVVGSARFLVRAAPGSERIGGVGRVVGEHARTVRRVVPVATGSRSGGPVDAPPRRAPRTEAEQRAHERRRRLLRRRVRVAAAGALVLFALLAWRYVPSADAFRIRHVEISGTSAVGELEARSLVDDLLRGRTIYTVDEERLVRRLEELPFVRSARVERHLPGGLELHVAEYRPLALGYGEGRFWLVARDGRILARASRREWEGRVPMVTLLAGDVRPGMRLADEPALRLLAARQAGSTLPIESVDIKEFHLVGRLEGDVLVRFGRPQQLRQKLLVVELMLREARRKDLELVYVDVTVPSRPAICAQSDSGCLLPRDEPDEEDADQAPASPAGAAAPRQVQAVADALDAVL